MIRTGCLILFLFFAYHSAYCEYHESVSSVFSSLRRTDDSAEKTYHFSRVDNYKHVRDPIIYADGYGDNTKMVVGFQNMLIFGMFESDKHYVIRVNEDLDQDVENIPSHFLNIEDSGELFDVVTLKPTPPMTSTTIKRLPRLVNDTS